MVSDELNKTFNSLKACCNIAIVSLVYYYLALYLYMGI